MRWIFGTATVNGVLSALLKLVTKLEKIKEQNTKQKEVKIEEMKSMSAKIDELAVEADRAERVAGKIKALLE